MSDFIYQIEKFPTSSPTDITGEIVELLRNTDGCSHKMSIFGSNVRSHSEDFNKLRQIDD